MTIATTNNRASYAGNGVTTAFSYPNKFLANADLVVVLVVDATDVPTTKTLTTHYTVSGAGDANGGTVTMITAPATGETLVIYGDPAHTQPVDLVDNDSLPAATAEGAWDRLTLICQRLKDRVGRTVRLLDSDTSGASVEIPVPAANNIFGWNSAGTALINYVIQAGTSLVDLAASAGASLIGWIQDGTGAILRTVQAKLRERVTFADFGATGDGTTDDTAAMVLAIAYVKTTFSNSLNSGAVLVGGMGTSGVGKFKTTSPLFFGPATGSGGRVMFYEHGGAVIYGVHTGIVVDLTGCRDGDFDIRTLGDSVTVPSIGVAAVRFGAADGGNGHRNKLKLQIDGDYTICGHFNYASESNTYIHPQINVGIGYASAIFSDSGTYWNGSAFAAATFPNVNSASPPGGGESCTNCHFYGARFSQTDAVSVNGVSAIQLIGANKYTFHGYFGDVADSGLNNILLHRDTASGGTAPAQISIFGYNPHASTGDIGILAKTSVIELEVFGKAFTGTGAATADFQSEAGTTLTDCRLQLEKIDIDGNAAGYNQFFVGTSFDAAGTIEGDIFTSASATVTLAGNNSQKRVRVWDANSGLRYKGRDVLDFATASTSGTGEDNLKTYSITGSANFMGMEGRIMEVRAAGTKTGAAGNKTIKFHLGATNWTVFPAANDTLAWAFEAVIYATASNAQLIFLKLVQNNTVIYDQPVTAAEDLTATKTMKLTGECANGADTITQTLWDVRVVR